MPARPVNARPVSTSLNPFPMPEQRVEAKKTILDPIDRASEILFGLIMAPWLSVPPSLDETGLRPRLHSIYQHIAEFVIAGMQVTQVFSVRLAILTLAMPVFMLFSLVALVDGFVKRDLRRWGGGRESSFVYHWAKRSAMPLLVLSWVIYLALPFSLHPTFIALGRAPPAALRRHARCVAPACRRRRSHR